MKMASVAQVKAQFSAYLKECASGPVVVTRNGKPVAVLVALQDEDDLESLILAHSPKFQALLEAAREQIRTGVGIPHEDFWQEMEKKKPSKPRKNTRRKSATKGQT
jgi:prevent-host-death family protein